MRIKKNGTHQIGLLLINYRMLGCYLWIPFRDWISNKGTRRMKGRWNESGGKKKKDGVWFSTEIRSAAQIKRKDPSSKPNNTWEEMISQSQKSYQHKLNG